MNQILLMMVIAKRHLWIQLQSGSFVRDTTVLQILSIGWRMKTFQEASPDTTFSFSVLIAQWTVLHEMRVAVIMLFGEKPKIMSVFKKRNKQLKWPSSAVGWERLQPLSVSCQDGWLEKMTVINPALSSVNSTVGGLLHQSAALIK